MNRQPLEILTLDPRGAVTQAYDRQVSSPNPAPDTDPAYDEKLGLLGIAQARAGRDDRYLEPFRWERVA